MSQGLLQPLGHVRRESTTVSISRQLLDYLLSGRVQPGDRLLPERKLAESMGVGRSVVREALKSLTLLGLLEVRLGDGTYVKSVDADVLPGSIAWGLVLGAGHVPDLLEARRHLDVILAGLAAIRRDEHDMADIHVVYTAMQAAHRDPRRFVAAQVAFLRAVTEIAGNDVLARAASTTRALLQHWVARARLSSESMDRQVADAAAVIDAIAEGDASAARTAMAAAIDRANAEVRQVLSEPCS